MYNLYIYIILAKVFTHSTYEMLPKSHWLDLIFYFILRDIDALYTKFMYLAWTNVYNVHIVGEQKKHNNLRTET